MTWGESCRGPQPRRAKRAIRAGLALALGMVLALPAQAQSVGPPVVSSADVRATVVRPLSLIKVANLDFGPIIAGSTVGTVTVGAANGARSKTGGVTLPSGNGRPASFAGMGSNRQRLSLRVSANTITLTRVGGTQTMTMNAFTIDSNPATTLTTTPRNFTIASPTGIFDFNIGATLRVGANQMPGTYRGQFSVTIQYQ